MNHLHKPEASDAINDTSKWTPSMVAPYFDIKSYQQRIDKIVGLSRDGHSIIRVKYAPQVWTDAYSERVPRYWTKRKKDGDSCVYIQPPRFVLEKRIEREEYVLAWKATRYSVKDGDSLIGKGEPPDEMYAWQWYCQDHEPLEVEPRDDWGQCCERLWQSDRARCYGYFRFPNDADLQRIAAAVRKMEQEKYRNPYAPMTPAQLLAIEIQSNALTAKEQEERERRISERINDFSKRHAWRIWETDPATLKHGKYFFTNPE